MSDKPLYKNTYKEVYKKTYLDPYGYEAKEAADAAADAAKQKVVDDEAVRISGNYQHPDITKGSNLNINKDFVGITENKGFSYSYSPKSLTVEQDAGTGRHIDITIRVSKDNKTASAHRLVSYNTID